MRAMKDSGISWVGEIPEEWAIFPARYAFSEIRTKNTNGAVTNALKFYNGTIVPKTNFDADSDEYVADTITNYTVVSPDTIMINGLNLNYDLKSLRVGLVKETGVITSAYLALWPNSSRILPQYATYLFKGYETKMAFHNMGAGIRKTLGFKEFKRQPVLFPAIDEQQRIVTFLDTECARIDAVMEQTRASIEEYKKLKQSVITQAVTKGICPNRPMKDSGIDWIGQIPADWEMNKVKFVSEFQPYCDISTLTEDTEITYTPMEFIKNGYYVKNTALLGKVATSLTPYAEGDIVIAKVTPCFENGNIAIMDKLSSGFGMGSSELFVLRAKAVCTKYLFYWLQNTAFMQRACATMTGTGGLKRVSPYFVKNCPITMPQIDEQHEIIEYLDLQTAKIESLTKTKEKYLSDLESYKKSLIFEYVTGKKEVCTL